MEDKARDESSKQNSPLLRTTIISLGIGISTLLLLALLFVPQSLSPVINLLIVADFLLLTPLCALATLISGGIALFKAIRKKSRGDIYVSIMCLLMGLITIPVYMFILNRIAAYCAHAGQACE